MLNKVVPIFIITCDRIEILKKSMQSYHDCIKIPFEIVICDQGSTFKPMKEFLKELESNGIVVYRWKEGLNDGKKKNLDRNDEKITEDIQDYFRSHSASNYVVTDPDIFLDNVNGDILEVYSYLLEKMPPYTTLAVGPMLRIDDIPDYYPWKEALISGKMGRHKGFHSLEVNTIQYKNITIRYVWAPIHTTFGMHRKGTQWIGFSSQSIRVFAPYSAKHLDWYIDPNNLSEDQKYYMEHASTNAHWSKWKLNKSKAVYVDIGELGWSFYLSAHLRWLKENTDCSLIIITAFDRKCLYKDSVDLILNVPHDFYRKFKGEQSCFGIYSPIRKELKEYFQNISPPDYIIPEDFDFGGSRDFFLNKVIYKPYAYSKKLGGKKKILIFPRHRNYLPSGDRNLPKSFYVRLIEVLCDEFHDCEIETLGLTSGSYAIEVDKDNYKNGVKEKVDLQNAIDECQLAVGAIGSQSALPKLALLQGVPTFIIGHEIDRHTNRDNWLKTKVGFYEISKNSYSRFDFEECISKAISFIREKKIMQKAQIRLTEETVQSYWNKRATIDGVRTTGYGGYSLSEQDERYGIRKKFIFRYCPKNLRTLDYGCGIGRYAGEFGCYLGVDFTEVLLAIAKERCPEAKFLKLNSPFLDRELDFDPELIFISNVLQHNPDDVVLKIFESFIPIVKNNITFGLYENTEAQSGHMRGRTGKDYAEMIGVYFKVYEWKSYLHRIDEKHAFTLIKGYCK